MTSMKKTRVAILFGGKSAEHEVSLQSAKSIIEAIDKDKYEIVLVGIDKQGRWLLNNQSSYLLNENNPKLISLNNSNNELAVLPGNEEKQMVSLSQEQIGKVDVVFPVLHGTLGEDGAMQGLLKLMDVPFVGADVLGSAVGMDKDVMKRLLRDAGIPIGKFISLRKGEALSFEKAKEGLGLPMFVKPANQGSSVGVHKIHDESEFEKYIYDAFQYDTKILLEEFIEGREIECSVLGNDEPIASVPGEIIPHHEFYSYEAKYIDENGAGLNIPAKLSESLTKEVQDLAVTTFRTLNCEGMARVDCFLTKDNKFYVNEINTIPGFTKISMYPKLWEASGIQYTELIDRLIQLAIERHKRLKKLKTSF
jgi:D-alanine-D-alanine ligase